MTSATAPTINVRVTAVLQKVTGGRKSVAISRVLLGAGREIDADWLGPTRGSCGGEVAGPGRYVQQAHTWGEADRVEQGRDRQGRDLREEGAVALCQRIVPFALEGAKLLGILR